jgi:hypothetical protein
LQLNLRVFHDLHQTLTQKFFLLSFVFFLCVFWALSRRSSRGLWDGTSPKVWNEYGGPTQVESVQYADEAEASFLQSKGASVKDDSTAGQSSALFGMLFTSTAASTDLSAPEAAAASTMRALVDSCPIATVFEHSKYFGPDALHALFAAVAAAAGGSTGGSRRSSSSAGVAAPRRSGGSAGAASAGPPRDTEVAEAVLELLMKLAIRNRDRISLLLPLVNEEVRATVEATGRDSAALTQRVLVGLLRICERLLLYRQDAEAILGESFQVCCHLNPHQPVINTALLLHHAGNSTKGTRAHSSSALASAECASDALLCPSNSLILQVMAMLDLSPNAPDYVRDLAPPLARSIFSLIRTCGHLMHEQQSWDILLSSLANTCSHPGAVLVAADALEAICREPVCLSPANVMDVIAAVAVIAGRASSIIRNSPDGGGASGRRRGPDDSASEREGRRKEGEVRSRGGGGALHVDTVRRIISNLEGVAAWLRIWRQQQAQVCLLLFFQ